MSGRKRKPGQRKPCGRLTQVLEDTRTQSAAMRARDNILAGMLDANWGSPIGKLFLQKEISSAQFDAANKYAQLRAAADREQGLPFRAAKAINYAALKITSSVDNSEAKQQIITSCAEAEDAVGRQTTAFRALRDVVIEEQWPAGYEQRMALFVGLDRLCTHWGLTRAGKSGNGHVRNAG